MGFVNAVIIVIHLHFITQICCRCLLCWTSTAQGYNEMQIWNSIVTQSISIRLARFHLSVTHPIIAFHSTMTIHITLHPLGFDSDPILSLVSDM